MCAREMHSNLFSGIFITGKSILYYVVFYIGYQIQLDYLLIVL